MMTSQMSNEPIQPRLKRIPAVITALLLLGALLTLLAFAARSDNEVLRLDSGHRQMMGTYTRIVLRTSHEPSGRAAAEAAFDRQHRVDDLMSYHRSDSELARINAEAYASPVTVDQLTFDVLERAIEISQWSDGAFDITVGPLVDLWNRAADSNTPPTKDELAEAQSKVGWTQLKLDPQQRSVAFLTEGMRIDLGGIAKGYAIDRSVDVLRQRGVTGAMVDIGGDIRCFVGSPSDSPWRIGVQDPDPADGDLDGPPAYLWVLNLKNKAVATSGHYRRFALIDGEKVSHIMDAQSGHGSHLLKSVTVLADDAMTADALATAVSVLGHEKGMRLIEGLEGVEALIIVDDPNDPLTSSGMDAFLQ